MRAFFILASWKKARRSYMDVQVFGEQKLRTLNTLLYNKFRVRVLAERAYLDQFTTC